MRTAVVLLLTMPMAASSAMMAEMVSAVVSPGMAIMSRPTEHTQVMASSLSMVSAPLRGSGDHALILADGDKRAGQAAHMAEEAMTPPFFTASFSSASAAVVPWVPQTLQAHFFQNARHAVADGRGGRQGQIHDAEGHVQPRRWPPAATSCPMRVIRKAVFLIVSATTSKGWPLHALQGVMHHAGAGNAHVDDAVRLAHAVERAGHEGVVLHGVAEHHQLGAAEAGLSCGRVRWAVSLTVSAHRAYRVHVDARPGGRPR